MDRFLSPSLSSNPPFFSVRSRRCAPGFAALIYAEIDAVYYQPFLLPPSLADCPNCSRGCWMCACVKLETQTSVHANLTRPSVRHSTPRPTKKEVRIYYSPASPLHSCQSLSYPAAYVSSTGSRGRRESLIQEGQCAIFWEILGILSKWKCWVVQYNRDVHALNASYIKMWNIYWNKWTE